MGSTVTVRTDVLVLGAGLAGLYAALHAAGQGAAVTLATKGSLQASNSYMAQGGVAAAVGADDGFERHAADTMEVGRGLCDPGAVHTLAEEGPARIADLERMGVGDYELYGPEHFERWEKDTGLRIERGDILVIHTGYHRHYPENWTDKSQVDETKYFIRHPGPTRAFAEWVLKRGVRWIAVDAGSADHPMNTVIRRIRADEAEEAEKKLGRSLDEIFPKADYQIMHTLLFPHDIIHIENLGGQIDEVLDQKITLGCFPWRFQGGEASPCRAVAILE
jgi:kynurenine formamidase